MLNYQIRWSQRMEGKNNQCDLINAAIFTINTSYQGKPLWILAMNGPFTLSTSRKSTTQSVRWKLQHCSLRLFFWKVTSAMSCSGTNTDRKRCFWWFLRHQQVCVFSCWLVYTVCCPEVSITDKKQQPQNNNWSEPCTQCNFFNGLFKDFPSSKLYTVADTANLMFVETTISYPT